MSDIPFLAAQTALTDAHIRHNPTTATSITPSTSADSHTVLTPSQSSYDDSEDIVNPEEDDEEDVASISSSVLSPSYGYTSTHLSNPYSSKSRGIAIGGSLHPLPPLPDLRFEQSYLRSIQKASDDGDYWRVAVVTIRDQILFPLVQGCCWNLVLFGWRYWNRGVKFSGASLGARVRRWWWDVNHWEHPKA